MQQLTITFWKDGQYVLWGGMDAFYAMADPDFLMNVAVCSIRPSDDLQKAIDEEMATGRYRLEPSTTVS